MTHKIDFTIPPTGEPLDAARLVSWMVQPGQSFVADEILLEIETDKSVIEVPAPKAGRMIEHLVAVDGRINADTPVAWLELEGEAPPEEASPAAQPSAASGPELAPEPARVESVREDLPSAQQSSHRIPATPAARHAMHSRNLEPAAVQGTGPAGRITLADVGRATQGSTPSASARGHDARVSEVATRCGVFRLKAWEPAQAPRTGAATVVLLHGLFADLDSWAALAVNLSRAGHRVLAFDLPGHGGTEVSAATLGEIVDVTSEAIEIAAMGPVVLVGHSFGAAVAARIAERLRTAVRSLVLIAPLGLGTEIDQAFISGVLYARTAVALERELSRLTADSALPSASYINELLARIDARRETLAALCADACWNGIQQLSIRGSLQAISCPISILHGRSDAIIPWTHALNAPPRVALHLVARVGHMPQWEASAVAVELILRAAHGGTW